MDIFRSGLNESVLDLHTPTQLLGPNQSFNFSRIVRIIFMGQSLNSAGTSTFFAHFVPPFCTQVCRSGDHISRSVKTCPFRGHCDAPWPSSPHSAFCTFLLRAAGRPRDAPHVGAMKGPPPFRCPRPPHSSAALGRVRGTVDGPGLAPRPLDQGVPRWGPCGPNRMAAHWRSPRGNHVSG